MDGTAWEGSGFTDFLVNHRCWNLAKFHSYMQQSTLWAGFRSGRSYPAPLGAYYVSQSTLQAMAEKALIDTSVSMSGAIPHHPRYYGRDFTKTQITASGNLWRFRIHRDGHQGSCVSLSMSLILASQSLGWRN